VRTPVADEIPLVRSLGFPEASGNEITDCGLSEAEEYPLTRALGFSEASENEFALSTCYRFRPDQTWTLYNSHPSSSD
jgi:hypothetical protein